MINEVLYLNTNKQMVRNYLHVIRRNFWQRVKFEKKNTGINNLQVYVFNLIRGHANDGTVYLPVYVLREYCGGRNREKNHKPSGNKLRLEINVFSHLCSVCDWMNIGMFEIHLFRFYYMFMDYTQKFEYWLVLGIRL